MYLRVLHRKRRLTYASRSAAYQQRSSIARMSATVARIVYSDPYKLSDFSCITAPNRPSGLRAFLFPGNDSIAVSWTPPSGGILPTGYIIYYEATSGGADTGSAAVSGASTSELTITGRTSGPYTVRIVALSTQLPSTVTITTGSES